MSANPQQDDPFGLLKPPPKSATVDYEAMVRDEATRQGVDPDLAVRIAKRESGFNPRAIGPVTRTGERAIGLMQLMPATARKWKVNPLKAEENIRGGISELREQLVRYGSPQLGSAAYNAGPGNVDKHGGVPPFKQTKGYVRNVAPQQDADDPFGLLGGAADTSASTVNSPDWQVIDKGKPLTPEQEQQIKGYNAAHATVQDAASVDAKTAQGFVDSVHSEQVAHLLPTDEPAITLHNVPLAPTDTVAIPANKVTHTMVAVRSLDLSDIKDNILSDKVSPEQLTAEINKRIYSDLGAGYSLSPDEVKSYAVPYTVEQVKQALPGIKAELEQSGGNITHRLPGDYERQLGSLAQSKEHEYFIGQIKSLSDDDKELLARSLAAKGALPDDIKRALAIEPSRFSPSALLGTATGIPRDYIATAGAGAEKSVGETLSGAAQINQYNLTADWLNGLIDAYGQGLQTEGKIQSNLHKPKGVAGVLAQGVGEIAPDLAAAALVPESIPAHIAFWGGLGATKEAGRGGDVGNIAKAGLTNAAMVGAMKPLAPLAGVVGDTAKETIAKLGSRGAMGYAIGYGMARAEGASAADAHASGVQFAAMSAIGGKAEEKTSESPIPKEIKANADTRNIQQDVQTGAEATKAEKPAEAKEEVKRVSPSDYAAARERILAKRQSESNKLSGDDPFGLLGETKNRQAASSPVQEQQAPLLDTAPTVESRQARTAAIEEAQSRGATRSPLALARIEARQGQGADAEIVDEKPFFDYDHLSDDEIRDLRSRLVRVQILAYQVYQESPTPANLERYEKVSQAVEDATSRTSRRRDIEDATLRLIDKGGLPEGKLKEGLLDESERIRAGRARSVDAKRSAPRELAAHVGPETQHADDAPNAPLFEGKETQRISSPSLAESAASQRPLWNLDETGPNGKRIYETTFAEYEKIRGKSNASIVPGGGTDQWAHRQAIKQALDEGKMVSPEVLRDYPDLAENHPSATSSEAQEHHHSNFQPRDTESGQFVEGIPVDKPKVEATESYGSQNRLVTKDEATIAVDRIKQRRKTERGSGGPSTEDIQDYLTVAAYHIEAGAREFSDFAKRMTEDLGEWVKPHLEDLHDQALKLLGKEKPENANPPDINPEAQTTKGSTEDTAQSKARIRVYRGQRSGEPVGSWYTTDPGYAAKYGNVIERTITPEKTADLSSLDDHANHTITEIFDALGERVPEGLDVGTRGHIGKHLARIEVKESLLRLGYDTVKTKEGYFDTPSWKVLKPSAISTVRTDYINDTAKLASGDNADTAVSEKAVSQTAETARETKLYAGERIYHDVVTDEAAKTYGRDYVAQHGADTAVERYKAISSPDAKDQAMAFAAIADLQKQEQEMRGSDAKAADQKLDKINDLVSDMAAKATVAARSVRAVQFAEEFGEASAIRTAQKVKSQAQPGTMLTAEETRKVADVAQELKETSAKYEAKLAEANKRASDAESKLVAERAMRKMQVEEKATTRRGARATNKEAVAKEWNDLKGEFDAWAKKATSTTRAGIDPEGVKIIGKMARNRVKAGINTVEQLVDDIHAALKDHLPDLTPRDVRDAISGYGKTAEMSRNEIDQGLRELRQQMRLISALQDAERGQKPLKSGLQREAASGKVIALRKQVDEVMRKQGLKPEPNGAARLAEAKKRILKGISELQGRIERKEYAPPTKKPAIALDREGMQLKVQRDALRARLAREYDKLKPGYAIRKAGRGVLSTWNLMRSMKASSDFFGATFRQGRLLAADNLKDAAQIAFVDQFKTLSKVGHEAAYEAMKADSGLWQSQHFGVEYTGEPLRGDGRLSAKEEGFQTDLSSKIPIVRNSEYSFTASLDKLRLDGWNAGVAELKTRGITPENNPKAYHDLGRWINYASGRGSFGVKGNQIASAFNGVFFAPRYRASRVQAVALAMNPKVAPAVRRIAARSLFKYYGTVGSLVAIVGLTGAAAVSLDPDDADYLKLKVGNKHYDLTGGEAGDLRLIGRLYRAFSDKAKGYEAPPGKSASDILTAYMRSTLSPGAGLATGYFTGRDFKGGRFKPIEETIQAFVPMSIDSLYQGWREAGGPGFEEIAKEGIKGKFTGERIKKGLAGAASSLPAVASMNADSYKEAPDDLQDIRRAATRFKQVHQIEMGGGSSEPGLYQPLRRALESNDPVEARLSLKDVRQNLLKQLDQQGKKRPDKETDERIFKAMKEWVERPFVGTKEQEKEFQKSLTFKQVGQYQNARNYLEDAWQRFLVLWSEQTGKHAPSAHRQVRLQPSVSQ